MLRFMEQKLPCISFKRRFWDTFLWTWNWNNSNINWKQQITSGDKLQKKKGIANILLLLLDNYICNTRTVI